jgi:hypothetical protein
MPAADFYYAAAIFLFSLMFNVSTSNLSTHLASNRLGDAATDGIATRRLLLPLHRFRRLFNKLSSKA